MGPPGRIMGARFTCPMSSNSTQFGHFYCAFYVESVCINCGRTVARAPTRKLLKKEEEHDCLVHRS
jgi:hypothetical protein